MAGVEITVEITGKEDVMAALDPDRALKLGIQKGAHPCRRCQANEDPEKVPVHKSCQCKVVIVSR